MKNQVLFTLKIKTKKKKKKKNNKRMTYAVNLLGA